MDIFSKYIDEYRYKECEDVFTNIKFNQDLLSYALEKVLEEEKIENTYLMGFNANEPNKLILFYEYVKEKYKYYFKDTKNMFIFLSGIFMLFVVIILSVYNFSAKKKNSIPFRNNIKF